MKRATAKDLRLKTAALLGRVRRGEKVTITYRGRSVAVLAPVGKVEDKRFNPIGFGIWRKRRDLRSVEKWLRNQRRPRPPGSSSTRMS